MSFILLLIILPALLVCSWNIGMYPAHNMPLKLDHKMLLICYTLASKVLNVSPKHKPRVSATKQRHGLTWQVTRKSHQTAFIDRKKQCHLLI